MSRNCSGFVQILALVLPWLAAGFLPFTDMLLQIDWLPAVGHCMFFGCVMIPFSPLMMAECIEMVPPPCALPSGILLLAGTVLPLVVALALAIFWRSRWFWLAWVGYLGLLGFNTVMALELVRCFV